MRSALLIVLTSLCATPNAQTPRFRQITIPTGPSPRWIAVADVNHDHHPDLVVANAGSDTVDNGSIAVLLGDGRGDFHPAPGSSSPTISRPTCAFSSATAEAASVLRPAHPSTCTPIPTLTA